MIKFILVSLFLSSTLAKQFEDPVGAFGRYDYKGHQDQGEIITIDDLNLYIAQPGIVGSGTKAVVWGHDIFGWNSGRTRELVDQLASETEYLVVLPDFFRGESWPESETYEWETHLQYDWYDKIKPYLEEQGITTVGTVGNCFGSYVVVHTSTDPLVRAGFSTHPSHVSTMEGFGEAEAAIYLEINENGAAQYFGPTPQEGPNVRPGGLADQTLEVLYIEEFEDPCTHGFFNRGDLSDPAVAECVERAYDHMIQFFAEYL